jgi:hypothetical protein
MTAVKIIMSNERLYTQGFVEVNTWETLRNSAGRETAHNANQSQLHLRKPSLFELLSYNLYELLKSRSFQDLPLSVIRKAKRAVAVSESVRIATFHELEKTRTRSGSNNRASISIN